MFFALCSAILLSSTLEMTKRYYPFEEYQSGRQMKVHVGAKQVDLGVANECRMPMVYGKGVT